MYHIKMQPWLGSTTIESLFLVCSSSACCLELKTQSNGTKHLNWKHSQSNIHADCRLCDLGKEWKLSLSPCQTNVTTNYINTEQSVRTHCPSPFFVASILIFIHLSIIPCRLNPSNGHQNALACTIYFKQSVGSVSRCHNAHVTSSLSLKFNAFTEMSFRPLHFAPRFEMPPRRATMYWLFWLGNFSYL